MNAGLGKRAIPLIAALVAALLGWFGYERLKSRPTETEVARNTPAATPAAPATPTLGDAGQETRPKAASPPAQTREASRGPPSGSEARPDGARPAAPAADERVMPTFDVVRVEPSGESVIAGRAAAGATVELLDNGTSVARAVTDPSGLFAFVPPPLATGAHEIMLQTTTPEGTRERSSQSVTVVIAYNRATKPLVAVTSPGQPLVVLSRPDEGGAGAPGSPQKPVVAAATPPPQAGADPGGEVAKARPAAAPPAAPNPAGPRPEVSIVSVEAEGSGRLFVSGSAAAGATLRLYLNDSFVAPGSTSAEGRLSFVIERGIRPGDYRVRLDDVDPVSGNVRSRAEVPFNVPASAVVASAQPDTVPAAAGAGAPVSDAEPRPSVGATQPATRTPLTPPGAAATPRAGASGPTGPSGMAAVPAAPAAPSRFGTEGAPARPGFATRETDPGTVVVPEVNTAFVSRGDNLWSISKRAYGQGTRYTVIYGANLPQIRNPSLIYPGQIFVVPPSEAQASR